MEADEIRAWLDANKDFYLRLYGLDRWKIDFEVDEDQDALDYGRCDTLPEYEKAAITIYSIQHEDEGELIDTISHELEHVLCAPYELFYNAIEKSLPEKSRKMAREMFMSISELTRNNIGRFRENVLELSANRVSDDPAGERLCQQPQAAEEGQQALEEPILGLRALCPCCELSFPAGSLHTCPGY